MKEHPLAEELWHVWTWHHACLPALVERHLERAELRAALLAIDLDEGKIDPVEARQVCMAWRCVATLVERKQIDLTGSILPEVISGLELHLTQPREVA